MKNVTITLDEDLAKWARVQAAMQSKSLSRMIAEILEQQRAAAEPKAAGSWIEQWHKVMPPRRLGFSSKPFDRASLYDRKVLR